MQPDRLRHDVYCLPVFGHRFLKPPLLGQDVSKHKMGLSAVWRGRNECAAKRFRFVELAFIEQCLCQGQTGRKRVRLQLKRAPKTLIGGRKCALPGKYLSEPEHRLEISRIGRQRPVVAFAGLAPLAQHLVQTSERHMTVRKVRLRLDGAGESQLRFVQRLIPVMKPSDRQMRFGEIGPDEDSLLQCLKGFRRPLQVVQQAAFVEISHRIVRVGSIGGFELIEGFIEPSLLFQEHTQIVVRHGMFGIDRQRPAVAPFRLRRLPKFRMHRAETIERLGEIGLETDGSIISYHRLFKLARCLQCLSEIKERHG